MLNADTAKGIIWYSDGSGQVFKARLVDYDHDQGTFWIESARECPVCMDVVIILKDGQVFPSGKIEWCGQTRLVSKERAAATPDGSWILCMERISN
jgi:hypothetical protein